MQLIAFNKYILFIITYQRLCSILLMNYIKQLTCIKQENCFSIIFYYFIY